MAGKISVIGDVPVRGTMSEGERGAQVLVAAPGEDVTAAARLAPAAVLLLVDGAPGDVGRALEATLWPRQRVLGVARDDVEAAVRAVVEGGPFRLRAALRDGEREVTLARGGVRP